MYKVKVNNSARHFEFTGADRSFQLDGENLAFDVIEINDGQLHFLYQNKSYHAEIVLENSADKTLIVKVNGKLCSVQIEDQYDLLLKEMGLSTGTGKVALEIKAPMPGLVLGVNVIVGQEIKKGDSLLVLEAMKMENMLKSVTAGVIKRICVANGDKVEKNQVLIELV